MIVRSVDVGYGNTKFVERVLPNGSIGCAHFPSIACISAKGAKKRAVGGARRTMELEIDGVVYEVGQDVNLVTGTFQSKRMDDKYFESPEYLALLRGAVSQMNVDRIDILVLGLPVAAFKLRTAAVYLQKHFSGKHPVEEGKVVTVDKVKVIAQPTGALVHYGVSEDRVSALRNQKSLIIDAGARTFDWLVTQGLRVVENRSHSVNRGMYDVVRRLAEQIELSEGIEITDYERLDRALRTGQNPLINGEPHDIAIHRGALASIALDAVAEMRRYIGNGHDIDNIILVGGGAFFFKPTLAAEFQKRKIHTLGESIYANVKGFQLAGMDLAKSATKRTADVAEAS